MTPFDWIVCSVLLGSSVLGFFRGITREVFSVLSWLLAFTLTAYLLPLIHPFALTAISSPFWALVVSGSLLFLFLLIFLLFLSDGVVGWVRDSLLRGADKALGLFFGGARGGLLVCLAYWGMLSLLSNQQVGSFLEGSKSTPYLSQGTFFLKESFEKWHLSEWILGSFKERLGPLLGDVGSSFLESSPPTSLQNIPLTIPGIQEPATLQDPSVLQQPSLPQETLPLNPS